MDYKELKLEREKLWQQRITLNNKIEDISKQLKVLPEYNLDFLNVKNTITQEKTPYLYDLLMKISYVDNDERTLEWGRGKNPVDYSGIEFTYNKVRYTTGYAHNWCTSEYFYIEYNKADTHYCEIENNVVQELNDLWTCEEYNKFEEYLKTNIEDELEQIALLIFVSQNLMQW